MHICPLISVTPDESERALRCALWLFRTGRHLERLLQVYADHYNSHRPHRSRDLDPPQRAAPRLRAIDGVGTNHHRRDRLGGLIHEYSISA